MQDKGITKAWKIGELVLPKNYMLTLQDGRGCRWFRLFGLEQYNKVDDNLGLNCHQACELVFFLVTQQYSDVGLHVTMLLILNYYNKAQNSAYRAKVPILMSTPAWCSTSELVNYIFLWVPTHIGLRYTSNYRYTNVNLVPTI